MTHQDVIRKVFFFFLLAHSGAAQSQKWMPGPETQPSYSVTYTGHLFGYYRYPDVQASSQKGCPAEGEVPLPTQVAQFRSALQRIRADRGVLVSMGDNFSPELLSRTVRNDSPGAHQGEMVSKTLFAPGERGLPSDNVGCFFRLMQFDAIVPGVDDFYFGPARLREIARFLAEPPAAGGRPTQLLAANLLIRPAKASFLPEGQFPKTLRQALARDESVHFDLPADVMPWLKHVAVRGAGQREAVFDCPISAGRIAEFQLPTQAGSTCVSLPELTSGSGEYLFQPPTNPSEHFVPAYYSLDPGSDHALCAVEADKTHCELFHVQYPLFQYGPKSAGSTPAPYYLPADVNAPAVFGVLDPDIARRVTEFNPSSDTEVAVGLPVEALRQLLQLCETDAACRDRHKVLLAQMPSHEALQLAATVKSFDMVITEADAEHASGEEFVGRSRGGPSYLLTPGVVYQGNRTDVLSTNLRRADFYSNPSSESASARFFTNTVEDAGVQFAKHDGCLTCDLNAEVGRSVGVAGADPQEAYAKLALAAMQQYCHADVALIQRRGIFSGFEETVRLWPAGFHYTPQQLIEEVLWKGDFTLCVPVQGGILRKVLAESATFDRQDRDLFAVEADRGRGLHTLGIQRDATTGDPLIRGLPITDDANYAVAMPSELGFGNAGYAEFPRAALPPGVPVSSLKAGDRVTGLACAKLPADIKHDFCQTERFDKSDSAIALLQEPAAVSHGVLPWKAFLPFSSHPKDSSAPDEAVARRGLWWINLQNISVDYSLTFVGGSDRTKPAYFSGNNSFSQLSTPEQSAFGFWGRARGGYSFPRALDFYVQTETKYTRAITRTPDQFGNFADYQVNIRNNLMRDEVGLLSKPLFRAVPVRILLSENLATQVFHPIQQFAVPAACSNGASCSEQATIATHVLNKNYQLLTRFGARLQNIHDWIEAGREYGANINTAYDYSIQDAGFTTPFFCQISIFFTLSNCVHSDPHFGIPSRIVPLTTTRHLGGWFLNLHTTLPVYRNKLWLSVDSYGEVFDKRTGDTTFDSRFYEDLTVSLNIPIWGNLILAPQVETFFYQNKVVRDLSQVNHYVLVNSSVKLEYSFDWHRGIGLTNALRSPSGSSSGANGKSR